MISISILASLPQASHAHIMSAQSEHTGHCLCGRTRYRAKGDPAWSCYCHCESCRRATGAPVTAYAGFALADFTFEGDAPGRYESSPGVTRSFCRTCGTPLTYQTAEWPDEIHLLVGSADQPQSLAPQRHVFDGERISWVFLNFWTVRAL